MAGGNENNQKNGVIGEMAKMKMAKNGIGSNGVVIS